MQQPKFKKGDWCFCEFKLQQIQETKEGRITSVTDGRFSLGSYDLSDSCFPLELRIKNLSDSVNYWHDKFHNLKHNGLNHPDLNRELISQWVEMCENIGDEEILKTLYTKLDEFGKAVTEQVGNLRYTQIEGVRIFR